VIFISAWLIGSIILPTFLKLKLLWIELSEQDEFSFYNQSFQCTIIKIGDVIA
jgi:hypothetical protein